MFLPEDASPPEQAAASAGGTPAAKRSENQQQERFKRGRSSLSLSVCGASKEGGCGAPGARSAIAKSDMGTFVSPDGKANSRQRISEDGFMKLLSFESVLAQTHSGVHERFAKKLLDEMAEATPPKASYFVFKRHMDLVAKCVEFNKLNLQKAPRDELDQRIRALDEIKEHWPSQRKDLEPRLADMGEITAQMSDEAIEDMLSTIVPWKVGSEEEGDEFDRTFDPMKPCLYMTEGSNMEKSIKMRDHLLNYCLVPLITSGPAAIDAILRFCARAQRTFARKPDSLDENFLAVILQFMRVVRALTTICKPVDTSHLADALALVTPSAVMKSADEGSATIMETVGSALVGTTGWNEIVSDIKSKADSTKKTLPTYTAYVKDLKSYTTDKDVPDATTLSTMLDGCTDLISSLREGMATYLKGLIAGALNKFMDKAIQEGQHSEGSGSAAVQEAPVDWSVVEALNTKANGILECAIFPAAKYKPQIEALGLASKAAGAKHAFDRAVQAIDPAWIETAIASSCDAFVQIVESVTPYVKYMDINVNEKLREVLTVVDKPDHWTTDGAKQLIGACLTICGFDLKFKVEKSITSGFQVFGKTLDLLSKLAEYEGLGGDTAARVKSASAMRTLQAMASSMQCVKGELDNMANPNTSQAFVVHMTCEEELQAAGALILEVKATEMTAKIAKIDDVLNDIDNDKGRWTDKLKGDMKKDYALARKTLFKVDGKLIEDLLMEVTAMAQALSAAHDLFGRPEPEKLTKMVESGSKKAARCLVEAKLFLGYETFKNDEVQIHKFGKKIEKELKEYSIRGVVVGMTLAEPLQEWIKSVVDMA
ncbi:unnamed protein product [Prorocentrum cordatum]|uniref:Uncharacterized protein n=1 Tax=Prorocentrum cordatum TaxID=2364126 RepID=A0ABN9WBA2_9DINO|nr:unnamed protein product [Polarella glacialis]